MQTENFEFASFMANLQSLADTPTPDLTVVRVDPP